MSHFSELKTKITNRAILIQALEGLGYTVVEEKGPVEVRGFFGASVAADFKILTKTHYDIGFVKAEDGNYEIVGDWDLLPQVSGLEQDAFLKQVKREYAKTAIGELARAQGYELTSTVSEETGAIEMVVSQW
jgi:hypothetical protein